MVKNDLKCNILLLAGVIEKFRNSSIKIFGLFPSHYLSALALSWDAVFNITKPDLQLIQLQTCIYSLRKV